MYDAFDLNGNGHLDAAETALMREVLSGSHAVSGTGYRHRKSTAYHAGTESGHHHPVSTHLPASTQNTPEAPESLGKSLIFWAAIVIPSVVATIWFFGSLILEMEITNVASLLGTLIGMTPVAALFAVWDGSMIYLAYLDLDRQMKQWRETYLKTARGRCDLLRKCIYINFILTFDILVIAGIVFLCSHIQPIITDNRLKKETAVEEVQEVYEGGRSDPSLYLMKECIVEGCHAEKTTGSAYCTQHRLIVAPVVSSDEDTGTGEKNSVKSADRTYNEVNRVDDTPIEEYYEDYRDEYEDYDDAWDDMEDDEDFWDD